VAIGEEGAPEQGAHSLASGKAIDVGGVIVAIWRKREDDIDLLRQPGQDGVEILVLQGRDEGLSGPDIADHRIWPGGTGALPTGRQRVPANHQCHEQGYG